MHSTGTSMTGTRGVAARQRRWSRGLAVSLGVAASLAACGGKAIIDADQGSGGTGGSTLSTTTTITTSTVTSCDALLHTLQNAIDAATACDPQSPGAQCNGSAFVYDLCTCQVLANEGNPSAVAAALAAYDAWVGQGCGPYDCAFCPVFAPGACLSQPGGGGTCTTLLPG